MNINVVCLIHPFSCAYAVQIKNIALMSAGSTNLTLQVSDICGQTQTGSLTVVVTNTVSLRLTHIVCLVSYLPFNSTKYAGSIQ